MSNAPQTAPQSYTAADIEVLEGLEPVRLRPGMYIGGTDANAMHHLVSEVLDNAMDEAVAGFADTIRVTLKADDYMSIEDNGRGIPIDEHPKYPGKSALEVILTTLHSGGKFSNKVYNTSGGLHGVGISVVNALSDDLIVQVAREKMLYEQRFSRGKAQTSVAESGSTRKVKGTIVTFRPDQEIFDDGIHFSPKRLREMVRSKAYLHRGVTLHWENEPEGQKEQFHYPNGLADYLQDHLGERPCITNTFFAGDNSLPGGTKGRVEWAVAWPMNEDGDIRSYVNTIPTPQGGTHEAGFRSALLKGLKAYAEMRGKKAEQITAEDVVGPAVVVLSAFIPNPQFQGQTKDKLTNTETNRQVENAVRDAFDNWISTDTTSADSLLHAALERAEERLRRRKEQEIKRKTAVSRRLRLPGKLADCSAKESNDTEIFLVEGDSAGGSAKQARDRRTQAILPLRGKILNVASATADKLKQNKELQDLMQALGCGMGKDFNLKDLRYERVVIMTDADVDGAHIATLLMTFFFEQMPELVLKGHVWLAMPPLYKMSYGGTSVFAADDREKEKHMATTFKGKKNIEISRFKGLGEMLPAQLKETTMNPAKRKMMQIQVASVAEAREIVRQLMGKNPEERLSFIRQQSSQGARLDI